LVKPWCNDLDSGEQLNVSNLEKRFATSGSNLKIGSRLADQCNRMRTKIITNIKHTVIKPLVGHKFKVKRY
jgi:hypothetical protein